MSSLDDPLKVTQLFPGAPPYGFPYVGRRDIPVPERVLPFTEWRALVRKGRAPARAGVHFFLDDYRFETCWHRPPLVASYLSGAALACTPDFSMFSDWPLAIQVWNAYRSRWVGAYWERLGLPVIPTVNWSTQSSWEWAFSGILPNSVIAVSAVGIGRSRDALRAFCDGYVAAVDAIRPPYVISVSEVFPDEVRACAPVLNFKPFQVSMTRRMGR